VDRSDRLASTQRKKKQLGCEEIIRRLVTCLLFGAGLLCTAAPSMAQRRPRHRPTCARRIVKSLTGDVYADPSALAGVVPERFLLGGLGPGLGQPATRRGRGASAGVASTPSTACSTGSGVATYGLRSQFPRERKPALGLLQFYLCPEPALRVSRGRPGGRSRTGSHGTEYETNFGDLQIVAGSCPLRNPGPHSRSTCLPAPPAAPTM